MTYEISEAQPQQFAEILALWASIDRHTALPDEPEYLAQMHAFAPDLFLVAVASGRIIGTIIGGWDGWRGHIARLTTHQEHRRQGIAQALVQEVERRLRARGARRIYALVDRRNTPAFPFWEAAGYGKDENIQLWSRNFGENLPGTSPAAEM